MSLPSIRASSDVSWLSVPFLTSRYTKQATAIGKTLDRRPCARQCARRPAANQHIHYRHVKFWLVWRAPYAAFSIFDSLRDYSAEGPPSSIYPSDNVILRSSQEEAMSPLRNHLHRAICTFRDNWKLPNWFASGQNSTDVHHFECQRHPYQAEELQPIAKLECTIVIAL